MQYFFMQIADSQQKTKPIFTVENSKINNLFQEDTLRLKGKTESYWRK